MKELVYEVIGHDMQAVEILLDPNEAVIAEANTLLLLEHGITYEARMGDGSKKGHGVGGFMKTLGNSLTGAGIFLTHFENRSNHPRKVAFTAQCPGRIVPVHLSQWKNHSVNVEHNGFLCATKGTVIDTKRAKRIRAGIYGQAGFFLQHLHSDHSHSVVFLHCCGSIMERTLREGEIIKVDPGAVVAFEDGVDFAVERAGNLTTMLFGGDIYLATLRGPGKVILQSLPWGKVVNAIVQQCNNNN